MTDHPFFPPVARDEDTAAFFDAARSGQLLVKRCGECGRVSGPEVRSCAECGSIRLADHVASGRGSLVSWVVVHQSPLPVLAPAAPYCSGIVELDEGPWLITRLLFDPADDHRSGDPLIATFVPPADSSPEAETIIAFAPVPT